VAALLLELQRHSAALQEAVDRKQTETTKLEAAQSLGEQETGIAELELSIESATLAIARAASTMTCQRERLAVLAARHVDAAAHMRLLGRTSAGLSTTEHHGGDMSGTQEHGETVSRRRSKRKAVLSEEPTPKRVHDDT